MKRSMVIWVLCIPLLSAGNMIATPALDHQLLLDDCKSFVAIIRDFIDTPEKYGKPIWGYGHNELEPAHVEKYGAGSVCYAWINAGGEQIPGEFIQYKGNVLYRLVVYEKPEYAVQAAATVFKREKTMVRGNRLFTYAVNQENRKNVSPTILKAAEDFLNRQD